jgi:hypothetical protein
MGTIAHPNETDTRDVFDDYPVDLEAIRECLPYAQRAVVIHQGEDWPTGLAWAEAGEVPWT